MVTDVTVKFLATELNVSVDRLICQFLDVGIQKTGLDYVSEDEKRILLMHINRNKKKIGSNKLTLQRKIHSTLNVFGSGGKSKKVQIEVRRKHTYVQYDNKCSTSLDGDVASFLDRKDDDIFNSISENNNVLINKKNIKTNVVEIVKKDIGNHFNNKGEKLVLAHENSNKGNDIVFKSISSVQDFNRIKNIPNKIKEQGKGNDNITLGDMSLNDPSNKTDSLENGNRKKISNDRRFRNRQRFRLSKSRNTKSNNSIKYKREHDTFFDMKYDSDDDLLPCFSRDTKVQKRKVSILTHSFNKPTQIVNRDIILGEMITVSELANKMAIKSSHLIKVMMRLGIMVTINQVIDQKTAQLVVSEMGHRVILRSENDLEKMIMNDRDITHIGSHISDILEIRAPVVTIMGHVDHGKTSLLDCIRSSKIVDSEAGGITQHIGAYSVEVSDTKKKITFLDTPGHEAFTAMRMHGVKITDIVVLVVAVDDGVMLQTIEAIQHVKSAQVPVIVALNKIDKVCSFDMNRIKSDLAQQGIISEDWGGNTQFVSVSAKSGFGIDSLLDAILLESELLELKVTRNGMATGVVIESYLDKGKGPAASVLVREGTLKCGDVVLCGLKYGRIRAMRNEVGQSVDLAGPSMPVEVFGLSGPPVTGDLMVVVRSERKAREVALYRQEKLRAVKLAQKRKNTMKDMLTDISVNKKNSNVLKCNIVLKADVQGSVEAIVNVLKNLSNASIVINVVGSGVGLINETDVSLAVSTRAILLGFNVRSDILARRMIESENLKIYYYSVIYDLINGVKKVIDTMVLPKYQEKNVALAEVRDVFSFPKLGNIAGCMILEGIVRRHNRVRVLRKKIVVYEGELESLRRFKDDVNEVRAGMECGIGIKNYKDIHSGDFIEIFENVDMTGNL